MSGYFSPEMINHLRLRKQWSFEVVSQLLQMKKDADINISRIKKIKHSPRYSVFEKLTVAADVSIYTHFSQVFDVVDTWAYNLRDQINQALRWAEYDRSCLRAAEFLVDELSKHEAFADGVNRQFILSCEARIALIKNESPDKIIDMTTEGLALSYPDFNSLNFFKKALLLKEPDLICSQALAYHKKGEHGISYDLLNQTKKGLLISPQDDRTKQVMLAPILLAISDVLDSMGKHDEVLATCEEGKIFTKKRNNGRYVADFEFRKIKALNKLGKTHESLELIPPVYFGYTLLKNKHMADEVLNFSRGLGHEFELYGVDKLPMLIPKFPEKAGEIINCEDHASFMKSIREISGAGADEITGGICHRTMLNKYESNDENTNLNVSVGNIFNVEAIMQRYGRDINRYFDTFASEAYFFQKQIRDETNIMLARMDVIDFGSAFEVKLEEMRNNPGFAKSNVNKQFLKRAEAQAYGRQHGYDETHSKMILEALKVTMPKFSMDKIAKTRHTYMEIVLINNVGINTCEEGLKNSDKKGFRTGIKALEDLRSSMDRFIVDDSEKIRMYPAVLANIAKYQGLDGNHFKARRVATEGLELCELYSNLILLPRFAGGISWNLQKEGRDEEAIPLLAQSYYGYRLVDNKSSQKIKKEDALNDFGIEFK